MASVYLLFDGRRKVTDLPDVCIVCGRPPTRRPERNYRRKGQEVIVNEPMCGRHPLNGMLSFVFLGLLAIFLVSPPVAGVLERGRFREVVPLPVFFLLALLLAVSLYRLVSEVHCRRIDARGINLWNVSRAFASAYEEFRREQAQDSGEDELPVSSLRDDPPEPRRSRFQPRRRGPIDPLPLLRSLGVLGAMTLVLFGIPGCPIGYKLYRKWSKDNPSETGPPPPLLAGPVAPPSVPLFEEEPRRFLTNVPGFAPKHGPWPVSRGGQLGNGTHRVTVNGIFSPNGIGMHPPSNGFSAVKFRLGNQAASFRAGAALDDTGGGRFSSAQFEVLGDGRRLYLSAPVNRARQVQECDVDVTGVDVLELRVHALGSHIGLHAVWVEPCLLQAADAPDE